MAEDEKLRVPYALAVHGEEEEKAVLEVLRNHKTIMGEKTKNFEQKVAEIFGKKHGVMVNSGSSANYLAFEILNLPKNSEVVTPILTFSTTLAPIIKSDLTPVFTDVELGSYLIDLKQMKESVTDKTKCLMIPSLMGNIPDLALIQKLAVDNNLFYVEDSCDTIGATFDGNPTGMYSHISTTSFYGSHIITGAGGGGMICVNDDEWKRKCLVLRGWGRSSAVDESESLEKRFGVKLEGVDYDSKFIFEEAGHNFLPLEISAAFGLEQLKKLPEFTKIRQNNFDELKNFFAKYEEFFVLPKQLDSVSTNWLAFPLLIKSDAPFSRLEICTFLEQSNIQTRPMFTGNVLRQPGFKNIKSRMLQKDFPNTDYVMKNAFLVGCNQGLTQRHVSYMENIFSKFLNRF